MVTLHSNSVASHSNFSVSVQTLWNRGYTVHKQSQTPGIHGLNLELSGGISVDTVKTVANSRNTTVLQVYGYTAEGKQRMVYGGNRSE